MQRYFRKIVRGGGLLLMFASFVWFVFSASPLTIALSFLLFVTGAITTVKFWRDA